MSETTPDTLYCANHPGTPTSLRCNRCEKPICTKCAVATPTGYRCPECVKGQQKLFDTTVWYDYPVAFLISFFLAGIGSYLIRLVGGFWLIFIIFLAPAAGVLVAEVVRGAVRRRRSLHLWKVMAAGIIIGCLPMLLVSLISFSVWSILIEGYFVISATTSAVARLRGINVRR
jgi:hypothetical protein